VQNKRKSRKNKTAKTTNTTTIQKTPCWMGEIGCSRGSRGKTRTNRTEGDKKKEGTEKGEESSRGAKAKKGTAETERLEKG